MWFLSTQNGLVIAFYKKKKTTLFFLYEDPIKKPLHLRLSGPENRIGTNF